MWCVELDCQPQRLDVCLDSTVALVRCHGISNPPLYRSQNFYYGKGCYEFRTRALTIFRGTIQ